MRVCNGCGLRGLRVECAYRRVESYSLDDVLDACVEFCDALLVDPRNKPRDPLEVNESLLFTVRREYATHEDPLGKNRRRPFAPCIEPCSYWRTAVPAVCFQADDDVLEPIDGTHPTI